MAKPNEAICKTDRILILGGVLILLQIASLADSFAITVKIKRSKKCQNNLCSF